MSDSLQEWTTYYQQLAEASRFAAAVQAQPSLEDSWNGAVASAFAGRTVTHALDTLDSWVTSAGYDTLSHMALDAVMSATPQPGDIYGPWRERLSEIVVTNGTLTFLESLNDDPDTAEAFDDQFIQYTLTRLSSTPASTDDDSTSDSSVAASPDTELTYVTMLDARGTENIDAWIAAQEVNIAPPPNIAQVTRALLEEIGANLTQWIGNYGNASTQLVGYDNAPPAAGASLTGVGPKIRVGGDASGLQIFLDGALVQNVTWGAGPQATWTNGGGNVVGGSANFGCVGDVDQGTITTHQICGKFIVPISVGSRYGGLSLTWPAGATFATISFQATQIAGDSSGGSWIPTVAGSFAASFGILTLLLCCKRRADLAFRARTTVDRYRYGGGNPTNQGGDPTGRRNRLHQDEGFQLATKMTKQNADFTNLDKEGRDTTDQAGRGLQGNTNDPTVGDRNEEDARNRDAREASSAATRTEARPPTKIESKG